MMRSFWVFVVLVCLAPGARADVLRDRPVEEWVVYAGDATLARPAALALTVAGAAVYTATLPFTFWSRDASAFDVLVRRPARAAFTRCMGCELERR